ncbi:hypothetical protein LDENG_00086990 [Lucifuga dentata]|nr:hypothetical protein LDENG_00086990 [Lucifuga dentata]
MTANPVTVELQQLSVHSLKCLEQNESCFLKAGFEQKPHQGVELSSTLPSLLTIVCLIPWDMKLIWISNINPGNRLCISCWSHPEYSHASVPSDDLKASTVQLTLIFKIIVHAAKRIALPILVLLQNSFSPDQILKRVCRSNT